MVNRSPTLNAFEFVALAALRAAQLMRGCVPRVPAGHKPTTTAQLEIIAGHVLNVSLGPPARGHGLDPSAPAMIEANPPARVGR